MNFTHFKQVNVRYFHPSITKQCVRECVSVFLHIKLIFKFRSGTSKVSKWKKSHCWCLQYASTNNRIIPRERRNLLPPEIFIEFTEIFGDINLAEHNTLYSTVQYIHYGIRDILSYYMCVYISSSFFSVRMNKVKTFQSPFFLPFYPQYQFSKKKGNFILKRSNPQHEYLLFLFVGVKKCEKCDEKYLLKFSGK